MCAGRSRGPSPRSGARSFPSQYVERGKESKGHQDSLLQPLWRLRRSHMVPNLVSRAVSIRAPYPRLTLATRAESPQTTS
jgi:hypothetical protein